MRSKYKNPYKNATQKFKILEILKDLKWHCSECELPGSQPAKALQMMRQDGYKMKKVGSNWEKRLPCKKCGRKTPHRMLISTKQKKEAITRVPLTANVRKKIIKHYKGKDEILDYKPTGRSIEIDHRIPEIRWKFSEKELSDKLTDHEIEKRYMLLVREHNLLKSRNCEKCKRTGKRQAFIGINFFYKGDENYNEKIGCDGCGWYHPSEWKEKLNEFIEKVSEKDLGGLLE